MSFRIISNQLSAKLGAKFADWVDPVFPFIETFACELWRDYPDRITKNQNLVTSFQRGFMQKFCPNADPPAPTQPSECTAKLYVYGTFYSKNASGEGCNVTGYWRNEYGIPETNIGSLDPVNDGTNWYILGANNTQYSLRPISKSLYDSRFVGDSNIPGGLQYRAASSSCLNISGLSYGDNLVRTDQRMQRPTSANCQNQPQYPVTNPPSVITKRTTIIYDNDTAIDLELNVNTDPDGNIGFPIVFANAEIKFILDVGGITIDNGTSVPVDSPPVVVTPPKADVTIRQPYVNDDNIIVDEKVEDDPKEEEVGEALKYVEVKITQVPSSGRSQYGSTAPDVYYAGWFEFQVEGKNYPREPIHFLSNMFVAPPGATGYAYTLYQGFAGRAIVYTIEEET